MNEKEKTGNDFLDEKEQERQVTQWLSRGRELEMELRTLTAARQRIYEICVSGVSRTREVNISGKGGNSAPKFDEYIAFSDKIEEMTRDYLKIQKEILEVIAMVSEPSYRRLLEERYLSGKTFEQISEELFFSVRHISRLHKCAISAVRDVMVCHGIGCYTVSVEE